MRLATLAAIAVLLLTGDVSAHDTPADWDWIGKGKVKNEAGELCCGRGVDCKEWPASMIKITPQGYLFPDGVLVPMNKVTPSADEFAHKCFWGGETKCSFYPMGGS
jgi:hypothetical protein